MKKLYLIFIVLISSVEAQSQIINFPDANLKAKLLQARAGLQIASGTASVPGTPFVKIDANDDGEIQVSEALSITSLWLYNANITNISGLENFLNLREFNCYGNSIAMMNLSPLTQLRSINISGNHISSLNVAGLSQAEWLNCQFNELTSLDVTGMTTMYQLQCQNNQLISLNFGNALNLAFVDCSTNLLTTLDANNLSHLMNLNCTSNNLETLYIKNNSAETTLVFSNNPNLQFICADASQLPGVQSKINQYGYTNCYANSNCDFNPGNPTYFIEGIARYDELNDGCDNIDIPYPNLTLSLSNGITSGNVYSNINGEFTTGSQATSVTITPQLENPNYFLITPTSQTLSLSGSSSPTIQNFCITPNGSHPDLEITMVRTNQASNAYQYDYILTYKNKGTNTQSGNISLTFDDYYQDFISATPTILSSGSNLLTWSYSNLKPFEIRTIQIHFYMNAGMFNPTLFEGDILNYVATITSSSVDDTPDNNIYTLIERYTGVILSTNTNPSFSDYFTLYPNPTHDVLNIKTKNNCSIDSIVVYNLLGQSVIQAKEVSDNAVLNVSELRKGTYIIRLYSDKGVFNSKFVKN